MTTSLEYNLQKICIFCKSNTDIMNIIIPYTYSYKSKELLEDIRSYVDTTNIIRNYYNKWFPYPFLKHSHNYWLNNHIWWYLKEGLSHEDHILFLSKCKRLKIHKIHSRIYKFFNTENNDINTYLRKRFKKFNNLNTSGLILNNNMIIGLLTPNERQHFIDSSLKYL
jgi:hypothetical protein